MMMKGYKDCLGLAYAGKGIINIMLYAVIYENLIITIIIKLCFKSCVN